jgi:D-alanine transaminase
MQVYLNGQFLPVEEARISPLDRGFLFGDGVYEVIPVYSRRPFRIDEHLARLQSSLDGIRLANPHTTAEWKALIGAMIERAEWEDQGVYLQVTRGAASTMPLRDHPFPQPEPAPTVFMLPGPLVPPSPALLASGASAVTRADNRWLRCDLKTTALLANVLLRQEAVDAGATETLLLRDGFLSEGSASNVFLVKNGVLLAPPKSNLMLPGVTYDVVLELAAANGVPSEVRPLTEAELRAADEVWMTSSTKEVLAITRLDGLPVGDGTPGPLAQRMHGLYQQFKQTVMRRADH